MTAESASLLPVDAPSVQASSAATDFAYVACSVPLRAASALGCPRKAEPTLLHFVANDVDGLPPIDHE
jgi:hypothetical protein